MSLPPPQATRRGTIDHVPWADHYHQLALRFGPRVAVSTPAGTLTYAELIARAFGLATRLAALGVTPGTPVATCLHNSCEAVWAGYGTILSGAAEVPLDPNLGPDDLDWCLYLSETRIVITDAGRHDDFAGRGLTVLAVDEIEPGSAAPGEPVPGAALGRIGFTSGTTGRPKAILTNHGSRWIANQMLRANLPFTPGADDRVLLMTPFTHGASLTTYAYLDHGASIELHAGVDTEVVRGLLDAKAIDAVFAPPTVLNRLCAALEGRRYDHVKVVYTGTSTLLPPLYFRARDIFGPVVRVTYGKSEITNPITVLPPGACDEWYAAADLSEGVCLGWPASGVEVRLAEDGEILLRGPHMLCGMVDQGEYIDHPPDAWHDTGDVGRIDERGRLFLLGRAKDVIKTGGYKLYPEEVERAFAAEVAVVGVPSEHWGEVVVAVAEGRDWDGSGEADSLTRYKRPRAYLGIDVFPRNRQGKLQRREVREHIEATYRLIDGPYPTFERR
ncbi:MAG: class I adenylate-forming enzyme family protein [Alphaproteobacteria bacterium]